MLSVQIGGRLVFVKIEFLILVARSLGYYGVENAAFIFKERFACDLSIPEVRICEYFSNFNELERTTRLEAGQLIGSSQPIVATVGDDIMLPCHLKPAEDVSALTVEWTRPDLDSIYVHLSRAGQETISVKHGSYQGRTSLSIDRLKQGNISLKLSKVKLSDGGKYKCHIPHLNKESLVELIVVPDAIPSPVISISGLDRVRGGVLLQCESKGWYPLPDVIWLDGEGNLLSAGPTETVRGPDGLYTVSSRVTVEKRHSNNFTCRVQQSNQTSEKHFIVPEDFFKVPPSSSSVIIGVSVGLVVCIVVVVAVLYFVWKRRQNMIKTKSCWDEPEEIPEMQPLNESQSDGKTLTIDKLLQLHADNQWRERHLQTLKKYLEAKTKELETIKPDRLSFKDSKKEKVENEVETLKKELQTKQEEFETKTKEIEEIKAELQRKEIDLQRQKEETNKSQLKRRQTAPARSSSSLTQGASQHVNTNPVGKNSTEVFVKVDPCGTYIRLTNTSKEDLKLEGWRLRVKVNDENPIMYTFEESIILRAEESVTIWVSGCGPRYPLSSDLLWKDLNRWDKGDKLLVELINCHEEIVKTTEEYEKQLKAQNKELERKQAELLKEKQNREKAEREVKDLKYQLDSKQKQLEETQADTDRLLQEEKQKREEEVKELKYQLYSEQQELEKIKAARFSFKGPRNEKAEKEKEVETLQKKLQIRPEKIETKTKELEEKPEEDDQRKTDAEDVKNLEEEEKKNKERPDSSQQNNINPAGQNSTEVFVEFDPDGTYIRLTNTSKEYLLLEGWKLRVKLNDKDPVMFTFGKSITLKAEKSVTIWVNGWGTHLPPYDLVWRDLQRWAKGDKLIVELINCHEEIVKTTEV